MHDSPEYCCSPGQTASSWKIWRCFLLEFDRKLQLVYQDYLVCVFLAKDRSELFLKLAVFGLGELGSSWLFVMSLLNILVTALSGNIFWSHLGSVVGSNIFHIAASCRVAFYWWHHCHLDSWCPKPSTLHNHLNNYHASIKYTSEWSLRSIPFMDTKAFLENYTDLHCKPTNTHQYLMWSSCHPRQGKKSIPYSQALVYREVVPEVVLEHLNSRLTWGYPD